MTVLLEKQKLNVLVTDCDENMHFRVPTMAQQVPLVAHGYPTSIHEDAGLTSGLAQWVKDLALP